MKKIFVVDDNLTNLLTAKNELESHYQVFTMSSVMKMIDLLKKITPDLILLDINMPEMDGFEALACLKSGSLYSDIPVIFLTSNTDVVIEERDNETGGHNNRTAAYIKILIKALQERGVYSDEINGWVLEMKNTKK
jgi:putative two-component system response regulator